jgi:hypothetical protein
LEFEKVTPEEKATKTVEDALNEEKKAKQADILVREAKKETALFHSSDGQTWADMRFNGRRETWGIRSRGFRRWLFLIYARVMQETPSAEVVNRAVDALDATAALEGDEREVYMRVAELDGILYIDLCDPEWRAIEVSAGGGWRVIDEPPVRFRRAPAMLPLPEPEAGGSIDLLRPYINVKDEHDFVLAISWLLAAFRVTGPYPVLSFSGEHGSAKSTTAKLLRALIDPNLLPLRRPSKETREVFVSACNSHVFGLDNLSSLSAWLSDVLCTLSTDGAFATRQLYTDNEEQLFRAQRPIVATGINIVIEKPDLADRAIFLELVIIPPDRRRTEADLWSAFGADAGQILGALLDAVAHGLTTAPDIQPPQLPRMADFAKWAMACEGALWPKGTFMAAYTANIASAVEETLAGDAVASAVRVFMRDKTEWHGHAKTLLGELNAIVGERVTKNRDWPQSGRKLTSRLQVAATFLRRVGIAITWAEKHSKTGGRPITITVAPTPEGTEDIATTAPTATQSENARATNGLGGGDVGGDMGEDVSGGPPRSPPGWGCDWRSPPTATAIHTR